MGNDPVDPVVSWCLAVLAAAVVIPVALAVSLVVLFGLGLRKGLGVGRSLVRGNQIERELARISRERHAAIADIVRLRNDGERRLRTIADENVIESTAEEWSDE
jgi:hypothetical protein